MFVRQLINFDTNTDTQTHRHTGTQTHRHTDTQAHRHRPARQRCFINIEIIAGCRTKTAEHFGKRVFQACRISLHVFCLKRNIVVAVVIQKLAVDDLFINSIGPDTQIARQFSQTNYFLRLMLNAQKIPSKLAFEISVFFNARGEIWTQNWILKDFIRDKFAELQRLVRELRLNQRSYWHINSLICHVISYISKQYITWLRITWPIVDQLIVKSNDLMIVRLQDLAWSEEHNIVLFTWYISKSESTWHLDHTRVKHHLIIILSDRQFLHARPGVNNPKTCHLANDGVRSSERRSAI